MPLRINSVYRFHHHGFHTKCIYILPLMHQSWHWDLMRSQISFWLTDSGQELWGFPAVGWLSCPGLPWAGWLGLGELGLADPVILSWDWFLATSVARDWSRRVLPPLPVAPTPTSFCDVESSAPKSGHQQDLQEQVTWRVILASWNCLVSRHMKTSSSKIKIYNVFIIFFLRYNKYTLIKLSWSFISWIKLLFFHIS